MILDPVPTVLVCGMGSHARSVLLYMDHYAVRTIYIVRSKYNTAEFEAIADRLFREIRDARRSVDHPVVVNDMQIDERDFIQSFEIIARIYDQEKHAQIITDITAGHKIISTMLLYAHAMSRHKFQHDDKLVYLYENAEVPVDLPSIDVAVPSSTVIGFLRDVDHYHSRSFNLIKRDEERQQEWIRPMKLTCYLNEGKTITGSHYSNVDIHRLKKKSIKTGLLDSSSHVTLKGKMWLMIA